MIKKYCNYDYSEKKFLGLNENNKGNIEFNKIQ